MDNYCIQVWHWTDSLETTGLITDVIHLLTTADETAKRNKSENFIVNKAVSVKADEVKDDDTLNNRSNRLTTTTLLHVLLWKFLF